MKQCHAVLLLLVSCSLSAHNAWSEPEVDHIFQVLYSQGARAASSALEVDGVSAFDFGMDLLLAGETTLAYNWYSALVKAGEDKDASLLGQAWVEKTRGDALSAMKTVNELLRDSTSSLQIARAHYLLGVIFRETGSDHYGRLELAKAHRIYASLGKAGGMQLCSEAMPGDGQVSFKVEVYTGRPPRDDEGS